MANAVTDADFQKEVLESQGVVLVDFWADWCTPCHMIAPSIEAIATEYAGKVKVLKLDVDDNSQTSGKYNVMSIPTVMLFKDGKPVQTFVGVQPKEKYVDSIKAIL